MLTETEKRFVTAANESGCPLSWLDINDPRHRTAIRERMSQTAYHEAGHFSARCFTQLELSHVVKVSIIPDGGSVGRIISERPFTRRCLESGPPEYRRSNGITLLLADLAGDGANIISGHLGEWESIRDYWNENYFEDDGDETDMSKAYHTAKIMETPYMPTSRILRLADRWTLEMLRIPAVWNIVETVSSMLVERGDLTSDDLEDIAWNENTPTIFMDTKWMRRVFKHRDKKQRRRAA